MTLHVCSGVVDTVVNFFSAFDVDSDGEMSMDEFVRSMQARRGVMSPTLPIPSRDIP